MNLKVKAKTNLLFVYEFTLKMIKITFKLILREIFLVLSLIYKTSTQCTKSSDNEVANAVRNGLNMHNAYRNLHQAENLKLSENLNKIAQAYAIQLAKNNKFEHSLSQYGENLFRTCSSPALKNYTSNSILN